MKDLILYGNLVQDTIHIYDEEFQLGQPNNNGRIIKSAGGIGNHVAAIELTGLDLTYGVKTMLGSEYNPLSSAFVIVDKKGGKKRKTSCVKWGHDINLSSDYIQHEEAQWHHISYVDALPKLTHEDLIRMEEDPPYPFISIDFCGARMEYDPLILNLATMIITSDTEINQIPPQWHYKCLIHHPKGSTYWQTDGFQHIKNPLPLDDDICILGAGDAYCVSFIAHYLKTCSMEESVKFAHENAYKFLVKKYKL